MSILFSYIMEAIEKEPHVCKLISIFVIYLNEIIPTSTFVGLYFRGSFFFLFFEQRKWNSYKTAVKALDETLIYALKNILTAYYNLIIITYERYFLDIVLNISLQNSLLASLLLLPSYRQSFS